MGNDMNVAVVNAEKVEFGTYTLSFFLCQIKMEFLMLVERLKDDRLYGEHLTLLYVSDNYGFVFKEELDILTKRFPTRFLTCYESSH